MGASIGRAASAPRSTGWWGSDVDRSPRSRRAGGHQGGRPRLAQGDRRCSRRERSAGRARDRQGDAGSAGAGGRACWPRSCSTPMPRRCRGRCSDGLRPTVPRRRPGPSEREARVVAGRLERFARLGPGLRRGTASKPASRPRSAARACSMASTRRESRARAATAASLARTSTAPSRRQPSSASASPRPRSRGNSRRTTSRTTGCG